MAGKFSVEAIFKARDRMTAPVTKMQNQLARFTKTTRRGIDRVNKSINSMGRGIRTAGVYTVASVGAITAATVGLLKQFSKFEDAEAAFTPLLGGAERAAEAVRKLNDTAASTPFQFDTLAGSMSQLLPVMNGDIENTIATMRMLGDTAGGNAQKLDSITRGYTKAMLKGKVDMESLNMIAEAGVPIFSELSSSMGITTAQLLDLVSAGGVTTTDLTSGFKRMTREGGIFFNGMQIASRTLSGRWSTLKDNVSSAAAELGSVLAPTIKDLLIQSTDVTKQIKLWITANKDLIRQKFEKTVRMIGDAIGWIIEHRSGIAKTIKTVAAFVVILKVLAAVMAVVNVVMLANPIGLIVVAIGAVIAAIATLIIWWDEIKAKFLAFPAPVKVALMAITGPIGAIAGMAMLLQENWAGVSDFFVNLWDGIASGIDYVVDKLVAFYGLITRVNDAIQSAFGFGDNDDGPNVPSGQRRREARESAQVQTGAMSGNTQSVTGEVVIRDETGRAEATRQRGPGIGLRVQHTGAFE